MPPRIDHAVRTGVEPAAVFVTPIGLVELPPYITEAERNGIDKETRYRQKLERNLVQVYGEERGRRTADNFLRMVDSARGLIPERPSQQEGLLSSQDTMALILFPHQLQRGANPFQNHEKKRGDHTEWKGEPTLQTTRSFLTEHVKDAISIVHVLPFNKVNEEWADRGFSQTDRFVVHPPYGKWDDISAIGDGYHVMGDLVVGHLDVDSPEFAAYQARRADYQNYFIGWRPEEVDQEYNDSGTTVRELIKLVRRPRTHPWLTRYDTADGPREVVTTFSKRQVDINYEEPKAIEDVAKVVIMNMINGVDVFRLDAITYMSKVLGTDCANQPNNYIFLEIIKDTIKELNPNAIVITETNVPHEENLSYFRDGTNGADAGYNFPLPGAALMDFENEKAKHLYTVVDKMGEVPDPENNTWFNVLSTHDGIGVKGVKGILSDEEIERLTQRVVANGGQVSYGEVNGKKSVYELNSTFWSALNGHIEDFETALTRMKTAKRILNALPGIPGDYIHQMLGLENYQVPFTEENLPYSMPRDINERKLDYDEVDTQLRDPNSKMARVFTTMTGVNRERKQYRALRPTAPIKKLPDLDPRVFAFTRGGSDEPNLLALNNLSGDTVTINYGGKEYTLPPYDSLWEQIPLETSGNGRVHDVFEYQAAA